MSSKVNNLVPHTGINPIGTSFAQAQAKMAIVRVAVYSAILDLVGGKLGRG